MPCKGQVGTPASPDFKEHLHPQMMAPGHNTELKPKAAIVDSSVPLGLTRRELCPLRTPNPASLAWGREWLPSRLKTDTARPDSSERGLPRRGRGRASQTGVKGEIRSWTWRGQSP